MPVELPIEAENLLLDLWVADAEIARCRGALEKRELEIAEPLAQEIRRAPAGERAAMAKAAGERIAHLRRTTYRSELAQLAGEIVRAERRRAAIMRKLDAFPQLGETVPPVEIAVDYDGERGFVIRTGGGRVFRFSLPTIIDRGVWRSEARYERGDAVTSDGSLWIAREDNPNHEPGKGAQWRLAVTRGRNGRDANRMRTST